MEEDKQVKLEDDQDQVQEKAMEEGVKSTKGLIQNFLQTLKSYRLYESKHPVLSRYLDRLKKDFDSYFEEFDSFSLQVGEHRLFYRGKVVYESQDVRESLAFLFYKDGIREIRFIREMEFREVVDFLDVIRRADSVNRFEDDIVTLLWEKEFSHILITTVDEFLEEGIGLVPATEEDLANRTEYMRAEGTSGEESGEAEPPGAEEEGIGQALNLPPGQSVVHACQLTSAEESEIKRKIQLEQESDYVIILIDNLIEILLHLGEDMDAYENMIGFFERTVESLLEQKEIRKAVMVLKNLSDTMESIALKDKQIFAVRRIIESISRPRAIELLVSAIKANGEKDSNAIQECLGLTTKNAIEPLCKKLGELDSGKWKKIFCDRLVETCREDIQPLVKFLADPNPMLICQILYILGKIQHPSTVKYLRNLTVHANPKVREETLHLLGELGIRGKELVLKFLGDPLPSIRGRASLTLARIAKGDAVKPVMSIILSEDFFKREFDEKSSFFRAIGETRAQEAIPALEKIARRRKWFQKAKWKEMRLCAANALKIIENGENPDQAKVTRMEQMGL